MMLDDEDLALRQLKAHRADVFDPKVEKYNGKLIKLIDDGTLVKFQSVVDAVGCASEGIGQP